MTKVELVNFIFEDLELHYRTVHEPLPLKNVSQRWGRRAKQAGVMNIALALSEDPRFLLKVTRTNARVVVPREAFAALMKQAEINPVDYWVGYGAKF